MAMTMDFSAFTQAFASSFSHTLKDWPAWLGFAASNYASDMINEQFEAQNFPVRALIKGATDLQRHEYFYHLKHPQNAMSDLMKPAGSG